MTVKKIVITNIDTVPGQGIDKNQFVKSGNFNPLVDEHNTIYSKANATIPETGSIALTVGTSTSASDAHTINAPSGVCNVSHGATAALGTRTVTITNSYAKVTSVVMASIANYGGNGSPLVKEVTPGAGSIVVEIYNSHTSAALSANFNLAFAILG